MNYSGIIGSDIANGEGVRVSLFVSGCTHHCKGCFNESTWDFNAGEPFTANTEDFLLAELDHSWIAGLSLLGGEPMEPANQRALVPFLRRFRAKFGDTKTIWCYTGCILERDLQPSPSPSQPSQPSQPSLPSQPSHPYPPDPPAEHLAPPPHTTR
ncbi:MAG: 4Fe-4S single cluster domain-containing protein, partial [bacterium]|nr:4Fe-4S single cluster domain-containing protein [bacterium]